MERITRVFREGGRVTVIHCGEWPNVVAYQRVDIEGVRYFKRMKYGARKLFRPDKATHCMKFVGMADRDV